MITHWRSESGHVFFFGVDPPDCVFIWLTLFEVYLNHFTTNAGADMRQTPLDGIWLEELKLNQKLEVKSIILFNNKQIK